MPFRTRHNVLLLSLGAAVMLGGIAWVLARPPSPRQLADRIQIEVAQIRELPFKHPVTVQRISPEEWRAIIAEAWREAPKFEHFWAIVRTIGLYRGPDREPLEDLFAYLRGSASGAFDARTDTFHLMKDMDGDFRDLVFAHELNHGLQHQHFDMQRYLLDPAKDPNANADVVYARQSVVEGEAAFIDALYRAKHAPAAISTRDRLAAVSEAELAPVYERVPRFYYQLAVSPYLDGYTFIEAVQKRGWAEVNKLYGEYPPVSSEQILHPEKWFAREEPVSIAWPAFGSDPLFVGWKLLVESVLGERQWRMVLETQGLTSEAASAAAGWNGDRFAVFRNETGAMLFLACTSWDTPGEAVEFANAYARAQAVKHPANSQPTRLKNTGNTVWIVEGATPESMDGFMAFNERAEW